MRMMLPVTATELRLRELPTAMPPPNVSQLQVLKFRPSSLPWTRLFRMVTAPELTTSIPDPLAPLYWSSGARPPVIVKPSMVELPAFTSRTVVPPPSPSITVGWAVGLRLAKPATNPPRRLSDFPVTLTRSG